VGGWRASALQRLGRARDQLCEEPTVREVVTAERIKRFFDEIGTIATGETRAYLTGGATAVLYGWRDATIDIDLRFVPERDEIYQAIPRLKNELSISTEDVAPLDFIPVKPDWEARSPFVMQAGRVSVHHFDLYAQALAKISRAIANDLDDVRAMVERGLVDTRRLREYFDEIAPLIPRYMNLDAQEFEKAVDAFVDRI